MIWRDTGENALIGFGGFGIDARAGGLMLVWAVHVMWITFFIMVGAMFILFCFSFLGLQPKDALRKIRRKLGGTKIHLVPFSRVVS